MGFAHRLWLLDGNLSHGLAVDLGHGQGGTHLKVLRVEVLLLLLHNRLGHRLNQLVVNLLLLDNWSLSNLRSRVSAEKKLTLGLIDDFPGLGGLNKSLKVVALGNLLGLSHSEQREEPHARGDRSKTGLVGGLLLGSKLLDDLPTLFADGNSGVGVLHESDERVHLLEMSVIGLDSHVEGYAHGKSQHEANESGSASQVLIELLFRDIAVGQVGEERGNAICGLNLLILLLLLFECAGLLR